MFSVRSKSCCRHSRRLLGVGCDKEQDNAAHEHEHEKLCPISWCSDAAVLSRGNSAVEKGIKIKRLSRIIAATMSLLVVRGRMKSRVDLLR